jgi:hypothetical protein
VLTLLFVGLAATFALVIAACWLVMWAVVVMASLSAAVITVFVRLGAAVLLAMVQSRPATTRIERASPADQWQPDYQARKHL